MGKTGLTGKAVAILQAYTWAMGDFKSLEQVRQEMELERQEPWRPPQNAAEVTAEMMRQLISW